mmetsp:Transcript_52602/g.76846  ORF Transcript_52602/g.76846 Transcript_52602/m.76846 type:complete len:88 (-) Transcript_52602:841-1104(-)
MINKSYYLSIYSSTELHHSTSAREMQLLLRHDCNYTQTRIHDCGMRRAAVGCLGLSRLSLRVAAGVNCASVLGDCHHFNAPPQSSRE